MPRRLSRARIVSAPPDLSPSPYPPTPYFTTWRGRLIRYPPPRWPCDDLELERQEAQHWLLRLLLGYPFLGPVFDVLQVSQPRVLDVATGTGIWPMDIAEMFPFAVVIGVDSVPVQPDLVPQNCEFELIDLDDDLPYPDESFDVIHLRFAHTRVRSFSRLLASALRLLRPCGLLLIFDSEGPPILADGTIPRGVQAWFDAFTKSLAYAGSTLFSLENVMTMLSTEDVHGSDMRVPIGHGEGRMGQLGAIHMINTRAYLDSTRYVMVEYGGYTDAEVDVLCEAYLKDVKEGPSYTRYHALSVRKRGD